MIRAILPMYAPAAKSSGSQPWVLSASTGTTASSPVTPPSGLRAVNAMSWTVTSRGVGEATVRDSAMSSV
ncbi:hypothetical protein [Streptomyces sp. NPDC006856]|uniref:hypothetical protein n=1 Tax=Streptomyces sp. NPDC006856 TaxID=3364766 RepID=UPI0036AF6EA4